MLTPDVAHLMQEMNELSGSACQEQLDEIELLQAMSKEGEFQWTQDPQSGRLLFVSTTM